MADTLHTSQFPCGTTKDLKLSLQLEYNNGNEVQLRHRRTIVLFNVISCNIKIRLETPYKRIKFNRGSESRYETPKALKHLSFSIIHKLRYDLIMYQVIVRISQQHFTFYPVRKDKLYLMEFL